MLAGPQTNRAAAITELSLSFGFVQWSLFLLSGEGRQVGFAIGPQGQTKVVMY